MSEKLSDGNPINTSDYNPVCPNGHPVNTYVTRRRGQGRVSCPVCGWNDSQAVFGSVAPQIGSQSVKTLGGSPYGISKGVTTISQGGKGIEQRQRPNVISR